MNYFSRYNEIVKYIQNRGEMSINELSSQFDVSPCTIRRLLTKMVNEKLVKRSYGVVAPIKPNNPEPPIKNRALLNQNEKLLIGKAASDIITNGETIILVGGTTVNAICPYLNDKRGLKVITNSIIIANNLLVNNEIEVIMLGGVINNKELNVTGYLTSLCIKELRADKLFFGVRAIHPKFGLMIDDINELNIYKIFFNLAEKRVLLVDHSKFDQTGTIALPSEPPIDIIITDEKTPQTFINDLRKQGIDIIINNEDHIK